MENFEIVSNVVKIVSGTTPILEKRDVRAEEKNGVGNIVTKTDKRLESYLRESITECFPDSAFIGEESAENETIDPNKKLKFVVDPLDGTTNYTNNWPHAVAVGIVNDKELIGGVIYDVEAKTIYFSVKGAGVYMCSAENPRDFKRLPKPTYDKSEIKKAVISHDTPYDKRKFETTLQMYKSLYEAGASCKTVGPISLDVLKTALGKENRPMDYNNAVWHSEVRAWDLCAATAILREFGGDIVGKNGKPLSVELLSDPLAKIEFIASGNDSLRQKLTTLYREAYDKVDERY